MSSSSESDVEPTEKHSDQEEASNNEVVEENGQANGTADKEVSWEDLVSDHYWAQFVNMIQAEVSKTIFLL